MNALKYLLILLILIVVKEHTLSQNKVPIATKGIIDLRDWDFNENGIIELNGEWEFYWDEFHEPHIFENNKNPQIDGFINVPSSWKNYELKGAKLPNAGYATFRLKVLVGAENQKLKLDYYLPVESSKVFVNGNLVAYSGTVGKSKEESLVSLIHNIADFTCNSDTLEIIIHVCNYQDPKGGLFAEIKLGSAEQINKTIIRRTSVNNFILGLFFLMMVYHLVLFVLRHKEYSNLYFALSCLGFFINYSIIEGVFSFFFPSLGFTSIYRLILISLAVVVTAFFIFVYSLFPKTYNKKVIIVFSAIGISFLLIGILPKDILLSQVVTIYSQIYLIIGSMYTIYIIVKAAVKNIEDSRVLLIGLLLFIFSMVNDTLHNLNIINTVVLVNFGLLTFFLFQSYIISARFSRAFGLSEKLTGELKHMNENLEGMVRDRTYEIEMQKEEILTQTEQLKFQNDKLIEMDQFKQGMTSMIVHDLKNPLNTILSVSDTIGTKSLTSEQELLKSTGNQMLNMVLDILDVSKFEEASMALNFEKYAVYDAVQLAGKQVEFLVNQKNIQLINNIPLQYKVLCDREIIERVFVNLFTNAVKYSPHNSKIEIFAYPCVEEFLPAELKKAIYSENDQNKLLIAVKDYGTGIKPETIPLVFQKFRQFEAVESGNIKSSGLGLTFCKLAIEAHSGDIVVMSEPNQGTLFWFTLKISEKTETINLIEQEQKKQNNVIVLTESEKSYLEKYLNDLKQFEYYEVTSIRKILATINSGISDSINAWKELVELAIRNSNQEEYEKLIKPL